MSELRTVQAAIESRAVAYAALQEFQVGLVSFGVLIKRPAVTMSCKFGYSSGARHELPELLVLTGSVAGFLCKPFPMVWEMDVNFTIPVLCPVTAPSAVNDR